MNDQDEGKELNNALASLERCCPGSTSGLNQKDSSKELHQALLELERARKESDALLSGIKSIISSESSQQAFTMVLQQLKKLICFDDAFVLRVQQDTDTLTVAASTSSIYQKTKWQAGSVFKRVLSGTTYNFGDINECPEWVDQGPEILSKVSSALHAPFYTKTEKAICICVSSRKKFFNKTHANILERFSPLAGQVLYNLEISELLRDEVAERKKAEKSLRETNKKLKEALTTIRETREEILRTEKLAVVGQMAGVVAHEVLNPITSVLLRVEKDLDQSVKKQMVLQKLRKISSEITEDNGQEKEKKLKLLA
ncbi:MAG: hypothetical protein OEM01_12625, partial [Desulfobulbaceae bacterium]|nr:hypothetical protein [Desulfobulbaceae bacterium]